MPVERLWSWLRQELTYVHTHRDAQELLDRIALFVAQPLDSPVDVHRRLKPKLHLDPQEKNCAFRRGRGLVPIHQPAGPSQYVVHLASRAKPPRR